MSKVSKYEPCCLYCKISQFCWEWKYFSIDIDRTIQERRVVRLGMKKFGRLKKCGVKKAAHCRRYIETRKEERYEKRKKTNKN